MVIDYINLLESVMDSLPDLNQLSNRAKFSVSFAVHDMAVVSIGRSYYP